nr:MAG TPA_asm: hypothetical protein [Caudoviricetes sp.]
MRAYITYISEEIHTILTKILYHLRVVTASGTLVPRWLLFLYPFLCDVAHRITGR